MAESIAIYFSKAGSKQVAQVLDEVAKPGGSQPLGPEWVYPSGPDHDVLIYEYGEIFAEYEEEHLKEIERVLCGWPSATFCIEMRGSKGRAAVESAASLALLLLKRFDGVVDDLWSESHIWKLSEIEQGVVKEGKAFLDHYRDRLRS